MRVLLVLLALTCAAPAKAQVVADSVVSGANWAHATDSAGTGTVSTDTLRARAGRVEAHFFAGRTSALRAMADSALAVRITDAAHEAILLRLVQAPDLAPTADWDVTTLDGRLAYRRPYRVAGAPLELVVVFDEAGRVANLLMRDADR